MFTFLNSTSMPALKHKEQQTAMDTKATSIHMMAPEFYSGVVTAKNDHFVHPPEHLELHTIIVPNKK